PPHHRAGQIGQQDPSVVHRVENCPLAERSGKNLALGFQSLDVLADEARLVFTQVEKTTGEKSESENIDGEDAAGKRGDGPPPSVPRPQIGTRARAGRGSRGGTGGETMLGDRRRRRRRGGGLNGRR